LGLIVEIEAAMHLGISVKLLTYFTKNCPKYGQTRLLPVKQLESVRYFDTAELLNYRKYLSEPWPKAEGTQRPNIPDAIKNDVRAECHLACAICGDLNKGEIAHIEAIATTANNSPDNLVLLCPNHHTEYDLGYKPNSNVSLEALRAAKLLKREARVRTQLYEANAYKAVASVLSTVRTLDSKLKSLASESLREVYETELSALMQALPEVLQLSEDAAKKDTSPSDLNSLISKAAPTISRLTSGLSSKTTSTGIRSAAKSVIAAVDDILIELDEVNCPHCGGAGTTGLVGDYCAYCKGDMVVSEERADDYSPEDIDEVDCPHCHGRGMTGLIGDICVYCGGSCRVSRMEATVYDVADIDEVDCPHCHGRGMTGLSGDVCGYCGGSQTVSNAEAGDYNRDDMDETDCPHCHGRGMTGLSGDICSYCRGSQTVSSATVKEYNREDIDEVDCPHCNGAGVRGLISEYCSYCKGSQTVSAEQAQEYDPDDIDEVDCPHCGGSGMTGLVGSVCALCKGSCSVSKEKRTAYRRKYPDRDRS
jgi:RecJ-like exonuclease